MDLGHSPASLEILLTLLGKSARFVPDGNPSLLASLVSNNDLGPHLEESFLNI